MPKRKFIKENLYDNKDYIEDMSKMIKHCSTLQKDEEYSELGVLLGYLRALRMIHHSHHWQTMGKNYYGDHLLFQRLYEEIDPEIDMLGEKVVGAGGLVLTNYFAQMHYMQHFMDGVAKGEALNVESYRAELMFVIAGEIVMNMLEEKGILTKGIEQAVGNLLDKHESHMYLLQQRSL